jgi:hypothetical protein
MEYSSGGAGRVTAAVWPEEFVVKVSITLSG